MTGRLLFNWPTDQSARPAQQTAPTVAPERTRARLPFSARTPVAAALVAAFLFGTTLPVAEHAGAQVEDARVEVVPAPGAGFDYVDVPGVVPAPVGENATILPYIPSAVNEIDRAPGVVQPAP
jgi:hypothetical protein